LAKGLVIMADEKKEEKGTKFAGEKKLPELAAKCEAILKEEMPGRPYLMVITTGYEIGKSGEKTTLAAQWSWRSNVIIGKDDAEPVAEFLSGQLQDAVNHPEYGVKKAYAKKK
jgi:hypothetical protein